MSTGLQQIIQKYSLYSNGGKCIYMTALSKCSFSEQLTLAFTKKEGYPQSHLLSHFAITVICIRAGDSGLCSLTGQTGIPDI